MDLKASWPKRRDSMYKPGDRSGAWVKVRANRVQELVIGGYIPSSTTFDSILVGYYERSDLKYAGRIRNGFTVVSRRTVFSNSRVCRSPNGRSGIFRSQERADGARA